MLRITLILLLALSGSALAVTPEEQNGCGDSPDVKSAEEVCSVYKKIESYYGKYNMITPGTREVGKIASAEPDLCRAYYTAYMRGRNVLCAYQQEAAKLVEKTRAAVAARNPLLGGTTDTRTQLSTEIEAGQAYKEQRELHRKYQALLAEREKELKKWHQLFSQAVYLSVFMGNEKSGEELRNRQLTFMLNTEKNCKGGSISNIPAVWWGGANKAHAQLLKQVHPRIAAALVKGRKLAQEGVSTFFGLETATSRAAANGRTAGSAAPDITGLAPAKDPKIPDHLPLVVEVGGGVAVDAMAEKALETAVEKAAGSGVSALVAVAKFAPGPVLILRFLVTLGYTGAVSHWEVGGRDVIAAGLGLVSFPAGLLVTTMNAVMARDEAHRAVYVLWSQKALTANERLKPQELSQQFCQWYEEQEKKDRNQTVQQALQQSQTPGSRFGEPGMPGSPGSTD